MGAERPRADALPLAAGELRWLIPAPAADPLAIGVRARGLIGRALKALHCRLDPDASACAGCAFRAECLYGTSFEPPEGVVLPGFGRVGALPHAWSLAVDIRGLGCVLRLRLVGFECANAAHWAEAVARAFTAQPLAQLDGAALPMSLHWRAITPMRLRYRGRTPRAEELPQAIAHATARRAKMLAAMHGIASPTARLPEPRVEDAAWIEAERFRARTQSVQPMGGWVTTIHWPEATPEAWRPWLGIVRFLGLGRQANFGFGRLIALEGEG
ncbi:MAG: CRISPR system precrRNA processing endoribonuclease RAMP protein Cas6 [Zetaproteobacteria bacterium]|nr:MAG: CRISPR system precrRNA processing endoribonuclease RAMP protein Cas6 [Zetaproteobacteria bacterium]